MLQSLYVRNDQEMLDLLIRKDGWIAQLKNEELSPERVDRLVTDAYLRTLTRMPTDRELSDCRTHVLESEEAVEATHDLLWALLNTQEFITNH